MNPTLTERHQQHRIDARAQLLDILGVPHSHTLQEPDGTTRPIYAITRYQSRTRETTIVDFMVIQYNTPLFITGRIAALVDITKHRFTIPPAQNYSGMVLHKRSAEDVIYELSVILYGTQRRLKMENL